MKNWKETSSTAWDGMELKIGVPALNNAMSTSLAVLGHIKEMLMETEDGEKKEWKDINGKVIDELIQEGKIKWKVTLKNWNKSALEKLWNIEEDTSNGSLKVKGMSTSKKYSIQIASSVQNAETFSAPYCSVTAKPNYSKDDGYTLDIEFTILSPGNGKELFVISQG